ncbi:hypothetical protein AB0280_17675 [Pseudarthrobacter sp902506025]|uniref:hypothetical protein n=1 Tax=Pseudarthrobacter sp. 902506025 TaxID=3155291 RepID=UPI00344D78E6
MIRPDTREHAIDIVVDRASRLSAKAIRYLATQLPIGIREAIDDFSQTVQLTDAERRLIIKHNVSIPYELLELAKYKEVHGDNITVGLPPRSNK